MTATTRIALAGLALALLGVGGAVANLVLGLRGRAPWAPLWLPPLASVVGLLVVGGALLAARRARRRWQRGVDAELARVRAVKLRIIAGGRSWPREEGSN